METQSIEVSYFRVGHILIPKVWAENFTSVRLITKVLWVKLGNGLLKKLKMVVKKLVLYLQDQYIKARTFTIF
jgi:hypothetical protein